MASSAVDHTHSWNDGRVLIVERDDDDDDDNDDEDEEESLATIRRLNSPGERISPSYKFTQTTPY